MDSWITIVLTLILLIVPTIIKAKKEKEKKSPVPVPEEEYEEYQEDEEEIEPLRETSAYQAVPESIPVVAEEGGADRIPTVNTEHFQVANTEEKKSKENIDVQKLIIYSEIMKPKFQDFDLK